MSLCRTCGHTAGFHDRTGGCQQPLLRSVCDCEEFDIHPLDLEERLTWIEGELATKARWKTVSDLFDDVWDLKLAQPKKRRW